MQEGWVNVVSRHTTTAVTLNECESRLMDDVRQFLLKLAPPAYPYLHNDIHLRPATEDVCALRAGFARVHVYMPMRRGRALRRC